MPEGKGAMSCRAARVLEEGGEHELSFRAISAEEAQQGYTACCLRCGSRYRNAIEWIVTECTPRPDLAGREAGGR